MQLTIDFRGINLSAESCSRKKSEAMRIASELLITIKILEIDIFYNMVSYDSSYVMSLESAT